MDLTRGVYTDRFLSGNGFTHTGNVVTVCNNILNVL